MSLLTDLQALKEQGISLSNDYGTWLEETNKAFQNNYPTDNNVKNVLNNVRQVWSDISKRDMLSLLESLSTPEGKKAFSGADVRAAVSNAYGAPKMQFTAVAKMAGDTPISGPRWQNTDVLVEPSLTITVKYLSGQWTANPSTGMVDADGNSSFIAKEGYTLPGANEGALVGRVVNNDGPGPVFLIGKSATIPNDVKGFLEVGINDDLQGEFGEGFADNEGSIVIEIDSSGVAANVSDAAIA